MADYVKKRTHIINHERFLAAGAIARDLYDWGMLWCGQQETDGAIPMVALLASPWGAGGKRNVAVAKKLIDVGLWERANTGYQICKWAEQGNMTKSILEDKRRAERERKARQRGLSSEPCPAGTPGGTPTGTIGGTPASAGTSTSYSPSGSGSSGSPEGGKAPEWWAGAMATAGDTVGPIDQAEARWLEYDSARERKGWARNHRDAVGWLCSVVRTEKRNARSSPKSSEITKQPFDPDAPWMKAGETG